MNSICENLCEPVAIERTNYRLLPHSQEKSTKASRTCVEAGQTDTAGQTTCKLYAKHLK